MKGMFLAGLGALWLAAHGDARADKNADKEAESTIYFQARQLKDATSSLDVPKEKVERCRADIAAASKVLAPTRVLTDSMYESAPKSFTDDKGVHLKVADAGLICDGLAKLEPLHDARRAVEFAWIAVGHVEEDGVALKTEAVLVNYETALAKCKAGIATAKAAGLKKLGSTTVDDGEKKCNTFEKEMVRYRLEVAEAMKEVRAYRDSLVKIYTGLGIGGEKMEFLIEYDKKALYAVGGKELTTAKELAKAPVLFSVSGSDSVTVRRYQFKGNKLVKFTEQDYVTGRPGPNGFR
ncbi:MAG: hypothetical protein H0T46_36715 [Deltaproteobacteria bacterium]|nr:hypothetical protein [Deltaproteobacteria bacterium]